MLVSLQASVNKEVEQPEVRVRLVAPVALENVREGAIARSQHGNRDKPLTT